MREIEIDAVSADVDAPVFYGGPVEGARGFVLHTPEYASKLYTMDVLDAFAMTATLDVLEDIARGEGPERSLMMLGYAGWGPGQLEGEIAMNGWLTCDASPELVFDLPESEKWAASLKELGVDPISLSAAAGRA